jgi:hypothetical protein
MWEIHIRICVALLLIAIPVALADFFLLKSKGGDWISLDFRGVLIGAYCIVLAIHLGLSSTAVKIYPQQSLWTLHGMSAMASIIVFSAGVFTFHKRSKKRDSVRYEQFRARRARLADVITLNDWRFLPSPEDANEIIVSVTVSESGRFACGANGKDEAVNDQGDVVWYFYSENVKQKQVVKNEHFIHSIPLKRSRPGVADYTEITLYLFADSTGSAGMNVIKIFTPHPETDDDGHNFYEVIPPPNKNLQKP